MGDLNPNSKGKPFALLGAVLLGFFLADMVTVLRSGPSLLKPSHWSGLGVLFISGLVLYAAVGVYFLGFYVMLRILALLLRLRFTNKATALLTVLIAPPFLVVQDTIQRRMIGSFMSPRSPAFYRSTLIVMGILIVTLVVIYLVTKRLTGMPAWLRRVLDWRGLVGVAFAVFILYTLVGIPRINILGIFTDQEQRLAMAETKPVAPLEAAAGSPNFIILSIEAFRSDQFKPENAPFLWQLAQDNIRFANYHTVSSATMPSVTSFFTSLYPAQHRCYTSAIGERVGGERSKITRRRVVETIQALPVLLQERGYRTLMITTNSSTADRMFGFEDVFWRFDATEPYRFRVPSLDAFVGFRFLNRYLSGWRILKVITTSPEHSSTYFEAPRVNATIRRELNKKLTGEDGRPFFLYVHYIEPHSPYYLHPHRAVQINIYSPGRRASILEAYRSEIGAVDRGVAEIYGFLKERGLLDNTYLFITSDHGEELYDHGDLGHGKSVYPEVISVPAILVLPSGQKMSRQVDATVESISMMPTLAEIAGVPAQRYWEGRSLVPLLTRGADVANAQAAYAQFNDERLYYWTSAMTEGWQVIFREPTQQEGSLDKKREERRKIMLFHLAADPLAQHDLYGQGSDMEAGLVTLLERTLGRLEASAAIFSGGQEEIDPEQLERLRALGYIQ